MHAIRLFTYPPVVKSLTRHIYITHCANKNSCKDNWKQNKAKTPASGQRCEDKSQQQSSDNKCCSPPSCSKPQRTETCSTPSCRKPPRTEMCKKKSPEAKGACDPSAVASKPETSCPKKPDIPCHCSKETANECVQQLQEIQNAWAKVAQESQKAWKEIEAASKRNCPEQRERPTTCCRPQQPPPQKSCGKFAWLCYLLGIAFILNLGYCVYKHSEDQQKNKNNKEEDNNK